MKGSRGIEMFRSIKESDEKERNIYIPKREREGNESWCGLAGEDEAITREKEGESESVKGNPD
jgi:hypothetical protein